MSEDTLSNRNFQGKVYCQICGKEICDMADELSAGLTMCQSCQTSINIQHPSIIDFGKNSLNILADLSNYQSSWLQNIKTTIDVANGIDFEPIVLGIEAYIDLNSMFKNVGLLQKDIIDVAEFTRVYQ